jgi:NAD(P)-dependent dehydrogenase (short-subunit alcohol dehydrogenase family)
MKTILITGSTDGIGKLAANKLAKEGHQVLLHGRNSEKLQKTISEIKEVSGNENTSGHIADLSDFNSVRKMLMELTDTYSKIDVLINNAGVFKTNAPLNQEGLDVRFAVNYYAPYLLTNGLKPLLKNNTSPRVINLSSAAQSPVSLSALIGTETLSSQEAYAQSKLALTMWSFDFAKANPEITTIAVNPGSLLNTKMANEAYGQHWSPATKGSDILYDLAISDEYKDSTGNYFDNDKGNPKGRFTDAHPDAYHQEKINQLLSATEKYLSVK